MRAKHAPGTQEDRFAAYMNGLAQAAEHADREEPLKAYCKGLVLPGERKSVEPMAAPSSRPCPADASVIASRGSRLSVG
jgi:SRSO17 transposase